MKTLSRDACFGLSLSLLSAMIYFVIIPLAIVKGVGDTEYSLSQFFFPKLMTFVLFLLGLALFIKDICLSKSSMAKRHISFSDYFRVALVTGICVGYIYSIKPVGYYLVTPTALIVFLLVLGVRKIKTLILIPIVTLFTIYLLFEVLLGGELPRGILN